jgi:hypothetical protein
MFSITFTKYPPILICKIEFFSSSSANLHRCTIRKALPQQPPSYSEEYVKNMTRLHQALRNNPKTLIPLVKGPDRSKYKNCRFIFHPLLPVIKFALLLFLYDFLILLCSTCPFSSTRKKGCRSNLIFNTSTR